MFQRQTKQLTKIYKISNCHRTDYHHTFSSISSFGAKHEETNVRLQNNLCYFCVYCTTRIFVYISLGI